MSNSSFSKGKLSIFPCTKLKLIVSTPKQVYNKYTFDLHVNFYPQRIDIISLMNMSNYKLIDNNGDWSFVGYK